MAFQVLLNGNIYMILPTFIKARKYMDQNKLMPRYGFTKGLGQEITRVFAANHLTRLYVLTCLFAGFPPAMPTDARTGQGTSLPCTLFVLALTTHQPELVKHTSLCVSLSLSLALSLVHEITPTTHRAQSGLIRRDREIRIFGYFWFLMHARIISDSDFQTIHLEYHDS